MCLAIPVEIIEIDNEVATCRVGESDTFIKANLMVLDGSAQIGDFLIVHAGFALRRLDREEAQESLRLLREMVQLTGDAVNF